jgi:hypothetical protein
MFSACQKIASYLQEQESAAKKDDEEEEEEEEQVLEECVSLASTVMGDKDWTTDLLLLMHLDQQLSTLSQQMLRTQEPNAQDSKTTRPFFSFHLRQLELCFVRWQPGESLARRVASHAANCDHTGHAKFGSSRVVG